MKRFLCIALPNRPLPGSAAPAALNEHVRSIEALAAWCERFSPTVAIDEGDANTSASLLLDVTGLAPIFGGEKALAELVVRRFIERKLVARVAIADTLSSAWAVAHQSRQRDRAIVVSAGTTRTALAPLPLTALRLDAATLELLTQLGLSTVADVLRLPRESLPIRFGALLPQRLAQALGDMAEVLAPYRNVPEPSASWTLDPPLIDRAMIESALAHLLNRVSETLIEREQGAMRLDLRLDCVGGAQVNCEVGLFEPSCSPSHLLELLRMRLERMTLPEAVERIIVRAARPAALLPRQRELFPDAATAHTGELYRLVDRLASRLGRQGVVRPRLVSTAQPELACRYLPLVDAPRPTRRRSTQTEVVERGPLHRPLRLRSPPSPLDVLAVAPDGPPIRFRDRRQTHVVARHRGPERIETSWWRGRRVRRDYYRVETDLGRRFWLFRELDEGGWFLHGDFD